MVEKRLTSKSSFLVKKTDGKSGKFKWPFSSFLGGGFSVSSSLLPSAAALARLFTFLAVWLLGVVHSQ